MNGSSDNTRRHVPCADKVDLISCLLDNELSPGESEGLQRHIEICTGCRGYAAALEKDIALFEARFSTVHARSDFTERVMNETRTESKREVEKMKTIDGLVVEEKLDGSVHTAPEPPVITGKDLFKPRRRWFGWLEAFAAVGVSLLLIAILFPVFSRAGEKARTASCQSNLKQIGLALLMFEQDKGHLPNASSWASELMPYLKNSGIFVCPYAPGNAVGYAMNPAMSGRRIKDISDPASAVLAYDAENGRASFRHNDGVDVLFADGHVKWFLRSNASFLGTNSSYLDMPQTSGTTRTVQNASNLGRHVSYHANLTLETSKAGDCVGKMESVIDNCGGFLTASNLASRQDGGIEGDLTARVPKNRFTEAVNAIAAIGRLTKREIVGEDMTEQYVTAEEGLAENHDKISQLLKSEPVRQTQRPAHEEKLRQAAKNRSEAQQEMRHVAATTELATISIHVFEPFIALTPPPAWSSVPEFETAKRLVVKSGHYAYILIGSVLICAPLWLPVVAAWWLWRRRQQRLAVTAA